jgi:dUTP pyrophosphatase
LTVPVIIKRLPSGADLPLPAYQSDGAAGFDLMAAIPEGTPITIAPLARQLIPTGMAMEIPKGYEGQVRPRSGLALRNGVTVLNTPGTIDSDYRGEVGVILINLGSEPFEVTRGLRIAQMVIAQVTRADLHDRPMLGTTGRGEGGFGSTGLSTAAKGRDMQ